jgi:hypothetical protein
VKLVYTYGDLPLGPVISLNDDTETT